MRPHDWTFFLAIGAGILAIVSIVRGDLLLAGASLSAAFGFGIAARISSQRHRGPMPHVIRWVLFVPRGAHSPSRLKRVLEPRSGERILEIGPGIGIHALPIASAVAPGGALDALDIQHKMLEDLVRRAGAARVTNVAAVTADAQRLPYPDATFDAAYLVTVLGEIPDEAAALAEMRRVLKPTGRLVVGEFLIDPDFIGLRTLREKARAVGLVLERTQGSRVAYFARFRPNAAKSAQL